MDDATRLARLARAAADQVQDGMTLGLGSGTTAEAVIRELGARHAAGLRISGVPTSSRTERLARDLGIPLLSLDDPGLERLDLGIDGADEIDPVLDIVKGRGGALLFEKLVALACADYLIVAAAEKLVPRLGTRVALPVEVVPFGWHRTAERLATIGCRPTLRLQPDQATSENAAPFVSDGGNFILDCDTGPIADAATLATAIKATPGVVDHGLFVGLASRAFVVDLDGTVRSLNREGRSTALSRSDRDVT